MKTYKNCLGIGVAAFLLIAVVVVLAISRPNVSDSKDNNQNAVAAVLSVADEEEFDFGIISMAAGKVSHLFRVKNTTADPVMVKKLYTSCMCTSASLEIGQEKIGPFGMAGHGFIPTFSKTIAPETEAVVEVVFDPAAHGPAGVGPITRVVYLEEAGGGVVELNFSAVVEP